MPAHPHAELMALYAKDATETNEPWKLWEWFNVPTNSWVLCKRNPTWIKGQKYRRKPERRWYFDLNMAKTLAEKIAVMQAAERGEEIECKFVWDEPWLFVPTPTWNWDKFDYRVKLKPQKFWVVFDKKGNLIQWSLTKKPEALFHWANDWIVEEYERTPR